MKKKSYFTSFLALKSPMSRYRKRLLALKIAKGLVFLAHTDDFITINYILRFNLLVPRRSPFFVLNQLDRL